MLRESRVLGVQALRVIDEDGCVEQLVMCDA
jgi:hypothetical protein